jgi:hypothetical protein
MDGGSNPRVNRYPKKLKLRPGEKLHDMLRDEVLRRGQTSHAQMSQRHDSWNKVDQQLTAFIPLSEYDKLETGDSVQTLDENKPISIVVPVSYAVLETLLTHLTAAYLDLPHFRYQGTGPEDELGAMLLEQNIMHQNAKAGVAANLHTMFRDALVYGVGAVSPIWTVKEGFRRIPEPTGFMSQLAGFMRTGTEKRRERYVKFEGNTVHNISPYSYLPDTAVSAPETDRMEYVGYLREETINELLSREATDDTWFNARYLEFIDGHSVIGADYSKRDRDGVMQDYSNSTRSHMDVIYMYISLIPDQWDLGSETIPQDWLFGLAGDEVIVAASPIGLDHNEKPILTYAPDYDGYSAAPISKLETVYGMQHVANFLFNSHIANVRKAINDMLIVDPELVNINDVLNPSPAKVIRLRKRAWGRGVQGAVEQLKINDITGGHLQEGSLLMQLVQNYSGATDSLQGAQRRGSERVSATEFRGTQLAALSRLEKAARVAGFQVMSKMGEQMASNTQQFQQEETWLEIKGRNEEDLRAILAGEGLRPQDNKVMASPEDLLIAYDVLVNDGSLPNQGDPQLWAQMFQVIGQQPELQAQFDTVRIFKHWARLSGAKNVEDFVRRNPQAAPQVVEDEEVQRQREAGNLVEIGAA